MTGLVMLGAIETNGSDVALDAHHADRHDDHRGRGDRRARPSRSYRTLGDLDGRARARPRLGAAGRAARRAAPTSCCVGELARVLGADPAKTQVRRALGRRRGQRRDPLRARSTPASTGLSEVVDQVEAGKMRLLAVSSPVDAEVDGKLPRDAQGAGHRPRDDQLAGDHGAAGLSDAERERIADVGDARCMRHAGVGGELKRYDWTAVRQDRRRARPTSSPPSRSACSGIGRRTSGSASDGRRAGRERRAPPRAAVAGPARGSSGSSCSRSASLTSWPRSTSPAAGAISGPRFAPLVASGRADRARRSPSWSAPWSRPDVELARYAAGEMAAHALADAGRAARPCWSATCCCSPPLGYALATTIFVWLTAWLLGSRAPGARRRRRASCSAWWPATRSAQFLNVQLPTGPWGV